MFDPFAILGVPRRFDLDEAELQRRFLAASAATHPDRFTDPIEQVEAAERAAEINEAYRVLSSPEARADALLRLLGGPAKEEDKSLPPNLLMEMMEVREELEEAQESGDEATIRRLRDWATQQRAARLAKVADYFRAVTGDSCPKETAKNIRLELNALRYAQRMLDQMPH